MKKYFLLCCMLISCTKGLQAQWSQVKNISATFRIKNAGINMDGKFNTLKAKIFLDEKDPEHSTFLGTTEVNSLNTENQLRDRHLKEKEEFFNAAQYPTITMKSGAITVLMKNAYKVTWDITIKGITRRVSSVVNTFVENGTLLLSTEFKIDRNDWKLGGSSLTMGDMVTIRINTLMTK